MNFTWRSLSRPLVEDFDLAARERQSDHPGSGLGRDLAGRADEQCVQLADFHPRVPQFPVGSHFSTPVGREIVRVCPGAATAV